MSVNVTDKEMDLLRELYDFYTTQMEGSSLDEDGQAEYEEKSKSFWRFYDKCRKARETRNVRKLIKRILKQAN